MATTYQLKVNGRVHTSGLSLQDAVKFATLLDYDEPAVRTKLLIAGAAEIEDEGGRITIERAPLDFNADCR